MSGQEIKMQLAQFCGSENYYKHYLNKFVYTDGIRFLAEICEANWLVDAIASYGRNEAFQVWELTVDQESKSAVLTMKEDRDAPILVKQEIPYTDFPLEYQKVWIVGNIMMLTSEY